MDKVNLATDGPVAVLTIDNPPVNALSAAVRRSLLAAVQSAAADPAVRAIVITGAGKTFIAGADITEFGRPMAPPLLPEVVDALDRLDKPVVAAIGGVALGGGLEVALGCHARIAAPAAKLGLPEVRLGLLPGAGGTQRLPRLIAASKAFSLMQTGSPVAASEALELGLIDQIADGDLVQAAKALALSLAGAPLRRTSELRIGLTEAERARFEQAAAEAAKRDRDKPNVQSITEAVRAAFDLPFGDGLAFERAQFVMLVQDDRSKALRHAFFAEREAAHVPAIPKGTAERPVGRAAVIGGGTMGCGIAACFANAGIPVTLIETDADALARGMARIGSTYDISVKRGSLQPALREARLALIDGQVGLQAAAEADLVIEAVFEDMALKQDIFATLGRTAKPGAILATNTSYLDVNAIAAASGRPQDVVGMHFFSPANVMRLLEVVRGADTAPDTLATAVRIGRKLDKVTAVVGVCHGFVGNRMLAARTVEAERVLIEGALPADVDLAITGFGFRMGPYAMADLAGLDIGWRIRRATGKTAPVADALCEAGRFGQKTGSGYYLYAEGDRTPRSDPAVAQLIEAVSARLAVSRHAIPGAEIVERLIYPMINEGARILEEGIAARPGDIDVIWLHGYNWPAWRGGPMFYADQVGLAQVAARLDSFADRSGIAALRPAPLLRRLAEAGQSFASLTAKA